MTAAQHQGHGRLFHAGNHFRNGKACLNIAAHRIQKTQQTFNVVAFLDSGKKRKNVLVFRGLDRLRSHLMALYLTDDGEGINAPLTAFGEIGAQFHNLVLLLLFHVCTFAHSLPPARFS